MKATLLPALVIAVLLTACSQNDASVDPAAAPTAADQIAANLNNLRLDLTQAAFVDEMYFMHEDMSLLLDPGQCGALDGMTGDALTDVDPRRMLDLSVVVYYNLIVKANPDLGPEVLGKLREMIAQYLQLRQRILQSGKSREEIIQLLEDAHNRLMRQINQLIGPEAVARVERLKAQLEQERKDRREEYQKLRIERQIEAMTRLLDLTEEEVAAVRRILTLQYNELIRLRELYGDNPEQFREALRRLQARIDELMSNSIGTKWERWKQLQNRRIGPVDRESSIAMRVKMLTDMLQLNERQAAAVKELLIKQQEQIRLLTQKYGNDRAALAEALKALQQRIDAQIANLLTPEQLERWKRYKSSGMGQRG